MPPTLRRYGPLDVHYHKPTDIAKRRALAATWFSQKPQKFAFGDVASTSRAVCACSHASARPTIPSPILPAIASTAGAVLIAAGTSGALAAMPHLFLPIALFGTSGLLVLSVACGFSSRMIGRYTMHRRDARMERYDDAGMAGLARLGRRTGMLISAVLPTLYGVAWLTAASVPGTAIAMGALLGAVLTVGSSILELTH